MTTRRNLITFFFVSFFLGSFSAQHVYADVAQSQNSSSVSLAVVGVRDEEKDAHGNTVYVVEPGQRFKVLVTASSSGGNAGKPEISGLDAFESISTNQSSNLININGRVSGSTRFEYQLECKDEGMYVLGPAKVGAGHSGVCTIRVRLRTQAEADKDFERDYQRGVACQTRLTAEKDTFFLGEDIPVSVDIYCWDPGVEVETIQPQFDGFSAKELPHTISNIAIDGRQVRVVQKKYMLSTMWPGEKKIKPATIVYTTPLQSMDDDFPFAMMQGAFLFGPTRSVQKTEARTNSLTLIIKELPKSERHADGIGSFSSLTLSLDKNTVMSRTPVNLSLKIVGKNDLSQVTAPPLRLPKGLRSFAGTTESETVKNPATGEFEKRFTYVVQPLKAGTFRIPPQEFLYFDPSNGEYRTLKSQDTVIISEGETVGESEPVKKQAEASVAAENIPIQDVEKASVLPEPAPVVRTKSFKMPWALWYVLAGLMVLLGLLYERIRMLILRYHRNPKRALAVALKALESSGKNEVNHLFGIAMDYFSLKFFKGEVTSLSLDSVEHLLEQIDYPRGKRLEFMKFLTELAGIAFGSWRKDAHCAAVLREELKKWLSEIDAA
jgi:hypothetical protein